MYLGVDYGLKHIGLAISEGSFSEPRETIHPKNSNEAINLVAKKVVEWGVKTIVVGLSEGKSKERSLGFGCQLAKKTGLRTEYVDETLSTKEVEKLPRNKHHEEHSLSASIILQRYLDDLAGENSGGLSYNT